MELIKNYRAEDATSQYLIAKAGTSDEKVLKAGAAPSNGLGVVCQPGDVELGDRVDVVLAGETEVKCGGNIPVGSSFTSDADGKAVLAATGERATGIVLETGVADRIIRCMVTPHAAA